MRGLRQLVILTVTIGLILFVAGMPLAGPPSAPPETETVVVVDPGSMTVAVIPLGAVLDDGSPF